MFQYILLMLNVTVVDLCSFSYKIISEMLKDLKGIYEVFHVNLLKHSQAGNWKVLLQSWNHSNV